MQPWPRSRAEADSRIHAGLHEIRELHGGVDLHVDVRMLRGEIRESRQQPLRQEKSERRHAQGT